MNLHVCSFGILLGVCGMLAVPVCSPLDESSLNERLIRARINAASSSQEAKHIWEVYDSSGLVLPVRELSCSATVAQRRESERFQMMSDKWRWAIYPYSQLQLDSCFELCFSMASCKRNYWSIFFCFMSARDTSTMIVEYTQGLCLPKTVACPPTCQRSASFKHQKDDITERSSDWQRTLSFSCRRVTTEPLTTRRC
jgi:hypothetical protein